MGYALKTISLILLTMLAYKVQAQFYTFNVKHYGAIADGWSDSTDNFLDTWERACRGNVVGKRVVIIPSGVYLAGPLAFVGPCKGPMIVRIDGILRAQPGIFGGIDRWIVFQNVNGLKILGKGSLDGQGASAWNQNQCKYNTHCKTLPVSLKFIAVSNAKIKGLNFLNSKYFHINIFQSSHVIVKNITITAPADSPNTDGIHVGNSDQVQISDSVISTGDDCISLGPGSTSVFISSIKCGPGHGISIGSLGKYDGEHNVRNITVRGCTLTDTTNGIRIKTWAQSPPSAAFNMRFADIFMKNVRNPIFINQDYCPHARCNAKGNSRVQLSDLVFDNIQGTSSSEVAVNLQCSRTSPCYGIRLNNINLRPSEYGEKTVSSCANVRGTATGWESPRPCI